MTFEQIHQIANRHQPDFFFSAIQLHRPKVNESGKEFLLTYPTASFFDSSLSTFLLVPFNILAIIAFLYWARSKGEVKSSISSSVNSSCLTLDEGIKNTHGSTLEGQRSLEFSTVSFAPPQVEVLKDGTAVNSLVAGTSYNLKVIVNNTALVEEETKVLMVVRTGKGARLEFGGDAMSNEQSFSIPAEGSHEFTYSFMLPQDTVGAAYIDVYTISNNGKFFKTLPVHEKYPVNQ
jgi:hypothetical protein